MLFDNCPAHLEQKNLANIKLVFLLPNMTSILQPMDQEVIKNLKLRYRKTLIICLIDCLDGGQQFTIIVYNAINLIVKVLLMCSRKNNSPFLL